MQAAEFVYLRSNAVNNWLILIKIRSDLSTCQQLPAIKVKLPDPLAQLWSELPEVDDMPYFSTKSEAGIATLKKVRENLLESPKLRDPENS